MATEKVVIYIHSSWSNWDKKFYYVAVGSNMSKSGYHLIERREIEFEVPPHADHVLATIEALETKKTNIRAEAFKDISTVDEEIKTLLCLEDNSDRVGSTIEDPEEPIPL